MKRLRQNIGGSQEVPLFIHADPEEQSPNSGPELQGVPSFIAGWADILYMREGRMKGFRSYRTCKLPSESATMSWMLPEDKRLLDQRQRSLSPKVWLAAQASCSCCLHLSSMSTGTRWNGTHEC
uniref:Uncharacterized protein n=1 Tax=Molossus molossus TaxID=27622 RepID=A0A7J8DU50_MOLMO|nr:hypothetical protein HJG59_009120 [Molossus molossus]